MALSGCSRCAESSAQGRNFCVSCGADLRPERVIVTAARQIERPEPRIVACPSCGAVNAASRRLCGRCRRPIDRALDDDPTPEPWPAPGYEDDQDERPRVEPTVLLFFASVVAGLVILGVLGTILNARGIGIFARDEPPTGGWVAAEVTGVKASSFLEVSGAADYAPANVVDGDPTTAWHEGASGDGTGEWITLTLAEPARVRRLLIWNGYQKAALYGQHNRIATLRIQAGERTFTVELLDVEGPQAVDFPEPVRTGRVRLEIQGIAQGTRYNDTALSEVEVYVEPEATTG